MNFYEWKYTDEGQLVTSTIRDHVSMASRDDIEKCTLAIYNAGYVNGMRFVEEVNKAADRAA